MSFQEVKQAVDEIGTAFAAFKEANDERIKALEQGDTSRVGELDAKLAKIDADLKNALDVKQKIEILDGYEKENRERIEMLEARQSNPRKTDMEQLEDDYHSTFIEWMRSKGDSPELSQKLQALHKQAINKGRELKANGKEIKAAQVLAGTDAAGGFAVPEEIAREIEKLELLFSPVRRIVKVRQVGTSDYKEIVNIRGATAGWVGETGTRSQTATPELREVAPTMGELYAYPQASDWALDDIFFNVEQWLASEVADQFARTEGQAVIDGNGTNRPTGLLNTTPVLTEDNGSPLRAAAALQYIACDSGASPSTAQILPDCLITAIYTLNSAYRAGAVWVMNSTTTGAVRKLKDANNQYLWQPGLQAGQPNMLLGYPVETWEQMQDIALQNFPIAFGNFQRGYLLTDRIGLRITRDNVTTIGFTKFYIRRREGGIVLNNDAIKFIRTIG